MCIRGAAHTSSDAVYSSSAVQRNQGKHNVRDTNDSIYYEYVQCSRTYNSFRNIVFYITIP